jgi:adenylate cyclase
VLFSDIRGFSRISYQLGAIETVSLLNTYLDVMVEAILVYRGTIDKFIGDAVMAEFGAPKSQGPEQDALGAIYAALTMREALATLRTQLKAQHLPPLYHGIGISYGELVVGNVGSVQRLEYTAIGDTVNVASRIEGLTKMIGTDILITQPCYELVKDHIITVDHGTHVLAGREHEAVQVYGVVALKGDPISSIIKCKKIWGNTSISRTALPKTSRGIGLPMGKPIPLLWRQSDWSHPVQMVSLLVYDRNRLNRS